MPRGGVKPLEGEGLDWAGLEELDHAEVVEDGGDADDPEADEDDDLSDAESWQSSDEEFEFDSKLKKSLSLSLAGSPGRGGAASSSSAAPGGGGAASSSAASSSSASSSVANSSRQFAEESSSSSSEQDRRHRGHQVQDQRNQKPAFGGLLCKQFQQGSGAGVEEGPSIEPSAKRRKLDESGAGSSMKAEAVSCAALYPPRNGM